MTSIETIFASITYTGIWASVICFLFVLGCRRVRALLSDGKPTNWPLIGILPEVFPIFQNFHDNVYSLLELYHGTFEFKGLWFTNRDMIVTSDPRNVHHVLSANFANYHKGHDAKMMFDIYGEVLFAADFDEWRKHRKLCHEFFYSQEMLSFSQKVNQEILEKGIFPVLDHVSQCGRVVDLDDVFRRFMFDSTCMISTGFNHGSLRVGLPEDEAIKAIKDGTRPIFMRHILPEKIWKFQRWLGVGQEKKLSIASNILDDIVIKYIRTTEERLHNSPVDQEVDHNAVKCFSSQVHEFFDSTKSDGINVLKQIAKGLILAATETSGSALSWFFWLLSKNPVVEKNIREEIQENLQKGGKSAAIFCPEELNKLIYLHGAICEALRLFPPAPFQRRYTSQPDVLPSGHFVDTKTSVILCSYSMGRMKSIWGEDSLEFKPERWISKKGQIIPVPSTQFLAFSSGPRLCPGKELTIVRLKSVAATIIHNYDIQVMQNHPVAPDCTSIILRMKHGLSVKVTKRFP